MDQERLLEKIRQRSQENREIGINSSTADKKMEQSNSFKFLYIVPSVILLASYLWDFRYFFTADTSMHWTFYFTPFSIVILILVLLFAFRSKSQTMWCALMYSISYFNVSST